MLAVYEMQSDIKQGESERVSERAKERKIIKTMMNYIDSSFFSSVAITKNVSYIRFVFNFAFFIEQIGISLCGHVYLLRMWDF